MNQSDIDKAITEAIASDMERYDRILKAYQQRCASCGRTDNLTSGYAAGHEVVYCPKCKRDEELS